MAVTLASEIVKSVSDPRVLVQLDIGSFNTQWINEGAGLWKVNLDNLYPEVDSSLLDGFTTQDLGTIGSVQEDGIQLTKVATEALVETTARSFYFDRSESELHVRLSNYDEPSLHDISLGVVYGYSFDEFTAEGDNIPYEARLISLPSISISRDPLFFGKLVFGGGSVSLANADGELDTFGQDNDVYGNPSRIYYGFKDLDIDDYHQFYTGYIGHIGIGEESASVSIADKRKQLTRPIQINLTSNNALAAIKSILTTYFDAVYNDTHFNTTAWDAAQASVENVSLTMQQAARAEATGVTAIAEIDEVRPAIEVIQDICASVFGLFVIDPDGRYSFKIVDTDASSSTTIKAIDILSSHNIDYDPTEVISSVRIGYDRESTTVGNPYTYYTDDSEERAVFLKYKTYNEQTFDTLLDTLSAATAYGSTIMAYFKDVHGRLEVEVPMQYYDIALGDIVDVEIERQVGTMIGTTKSEIVNVRYALDRPSIMLGLRFV